VDTFFCRRPLIVNKTVSLFGYIIVNRGGGDDYDIAVASFIDSSNSFVSLRLVDSNVKTKSRKSVIEKTKIQTNTAYETTFYRAINRLPKQTRERILVLINWYRKRTRSSNVASRFRPPGIIPFRYVRVFSLRTLYWRRNRRIGQLNGTFVGYSGFGTPFEKDIKYLFNNDPNFTATPSLPTSFVDNFHENVITIPV